MTSVDPITAIFLAITAATSGLEIAKSFGAFGGAPELPTGGLAPSGAAPTGAQDEAGRREQIARLIRQRLPDLQARLGGGLSPQSYAQFAASESGFPGEPNIALQEVMRWLGLHGGGGAAQLPTQAQTPTGLATRGLTGTRGMGLSEFGGETDLARAIFGGGV